MQGEAAAAGRGIDARKLAMAGTVILLLGVIGFAVHREMRSKADASAATPMTERKVARPPMTPEEENYASALWKLHVPVKQDAVRMTYAGLAYKMQEITAAQMGERVKPLAENFRYARAQLQSSVEPPASLRAAHDRYLAALDRYEKAAAIMHEAARRPSDAKLIEAQALSQAASEDLLRVGDVLWPGEHKPN